MITVLAITGAVVGVLLLSSHDEARLRAEWRELLSPTGVQAMGRLEQTLRAQRNALALTVAQAQLVDVGAWYLRRLVPGRLRLLALLTRYVRMLSAFAGPDDRLRIAPLIRSIGALVRIRRSEQLVAVDGEILRSCQIIVDDLAGRVRP